MEEGGGGGGGGGRERCKSRADEADCIWTIEAFLSCRVSHSKHRFPAPSSAKGRRQPVLGFRPRSCPALCELEGNDPPDTSTPPELEGTAERVWRRVVHAHGRPERMGVGRSTAHT